MQTLWPCQLRAGDQLNSKPTSYFGLTGPLSPQDGEYGTDEEEDDEEEVSPTEPSAIEVFDLAENEDISPLETDPEKLAHKYREVRETIKDVTIKDVTLFLIYCTTFWTDFATTSLTLSLLSFK